MFLQGVRHLIAAGVGLAVNWVAAHTGYVLPPEQKVFVGTSVYAIVEKALKKLWPASAGI